MKNLWYLFFLAMAATVLMACENADDDLDRATVEQIVQETLAAQQAEMKEGVLIHISAGLKDPHRVLMPLKMAEIMAESREVLVYFDIDAVNVVLEGADDLSYKQFSSSQEQLKKLIDQNVSLYVCPSCLEAAGHKPEDVMEGVQLADKEKFFAFAQGRILTLDY